MSLDTFTPREVKARPSTPRSAFLKQRYLEASLHVDIEYIRHLTASHRQSDGLEALERRAEDHAFALERLTAVIHPEDRLAGNKTRHIRGAIPYANYAAGPFLRELRQQEQDAQQKHIDQGIGGGIASAHARAAAEGYALLSGKFLISAGELAELREICEYWEDKCLMEVGDRLWKREFPDARFIEDGWAVGLYTAPHDPCPEGRLVLDYQTALGRGYEAVLAEVEARISTFRPGAIRDAQPLHFWRAARRALQGALAYAARHAAEAERLAAAEPDPTRRRELSELAETCRRVPAQPPRNFREAVQAFWFTYLLGHLEGAHLGFSPGRLDMLLGPYYSSDSGIAFDGAVELLEELFVKMTQIEYVASLSWQGLGHGNLFQNLILGGIDGDGKPADNPVSLACLQAQINMQMTQPTLSVWWAEGASEAFLLKAAECVKTGVGYPAFFNQRVFVEHEAKTSGLPLDVIRKHAAMGGCTEPTLEGLSYGVVQAGFVNHGKLIDLTLGDGVDPLTGIRLFESRPLATYEDVVASYLEKMHRAVRSWQQYWNYVMLAHRQTVPLVFCSVFVRDCLERGRCMDDGGARNNHTPTSLSSGLVNVANSLAAIRRLVMNDGACTLDELRAGVAADWKGHEALRKRAGDAPKWGNDDPYVDDLFLELFADYCAWVRGQDNYLGVPYDPSMLAISTPVPFGKACGAFPDGRRAGEPLADGVTSAYPGTDRKGPTAVVRSSVKVDHTQIRGGLLNLKFHPTALAGERGSRNLLALIKTYFDGPGFHMQFNVVDSEMLRDAQVHPERYRDLVVRVAGFSAYWVEMSRALQDQVISRTEHCL
ncbi:MAG TPA: pyruvate formate lyase family protein [Thermoanaerobaculaceae bacterium]|nr:pyruvate formate lyase family protein [Thermoanaerobaculaceae bacterium]